MLTFLQRAANRSEKAAAATAVELVPASEDRHQSRRMTWCFCSRRRGGRGRLELSYMRRLN
jgi:hypothetical protein